MQKKKWKPSEHYKIVLNIHTGMFFASISLFNSLPQSVSSCSSKHSFVKAFDRYFASDKFSFGISWVFLVFLELSFSPPPPPPNLSLSFSIFFLTFSSPLFNEHLNISQLVLFGNPCSVYIIAIIIFLLSPVDRLNLVTVMKFRILKEKQQLSLCVDLSPIARFCSTLCWRRNRTNVASEARPRFSTLSLYVDHVTSGLTTVSRRSPFFFSPWSFCC